jgi:hypothetical protein
MTHNFPDHLDPTERVIISKLLDTILAAGYSIDVRDAYGDGDEPMEPTNNRTLIEAEVAATGETCLDIYDADGARGFILLIHGNGEDVISDSSDNETINALVQDDE